MSLPLNQGPLLSIVGILDDGWAGLSATAQQAVQSAGLVIGAGRTLALLAPHLPDNCRCEDMDGALGPVPGWLQAAHAAGQNAVLLATGDPLCHGIASLVLGKLPPAIAAQVTILPAPSTLQLAFARLKKPWQGVHIASVHSKDAGEWAMGVEPSHGLYALVRAVSEYSRLAVFTGPENNPARIARALLSAGFGETVRLSVAACLALPDEAIFADLTLAEAAAQDFPEPNIVVLERQMPAAAERFPLMGLDDLDFQQRQPEKGLITKLEARAVSLAKLALRPESIVWDIGAGSGSVGLEASRLARRGHVWAIEKNAGDAENARANALTLQASNYTLCVGKAPQGLENWPDPDAIFIGGSGGELATLITLCLSRLKPGGRLVMNFVTLENLATATETLKAATGIQWDATQLQAARTQPILDMHRFAAQNPVWILCARKLAASNDQ
jgi:precorrin-6Y C5,15-methyltransferase (decarboxylating)